MKSFSSLARIRDRAGSGRVFLNKFKLELFANSPTRTMLNSAINLNIPTLTKIINKSFLSAKCLEIFGNFILLHLIYILFKNFPGFKC